ncbi:hypothetical protein [Streptomyces regalis]|uniref:Uncharacterized protein n=1 Tax=Streptomyces regalis TaxID=68262 RepID=A0A0X3VJX3_9ACTN|nr:hypothetical protein [Streptomyces regalis]KUL43766.1 hypothetical protein ADL12_06760 [Streptomyces regalis]
MPDIDGHPGEWAACHGVQVGAEFHRGSEVDLAVEFDGGVSGEAAAGQGAGCVDWRMFGVRWLLFLHDGPHRWGGRPGETVVSFGDDERSAGDGAADDGGALPEHVVDEGGGDHLGRPRSATMRWAERSVIWQAVAT